MCRVDLRELQDGDAHADDEEPHHESDNLADWCREALEEDNRCDDGEEGDCGKRTVGQYFEREGRQLTDISRSKLA